VSRNLEVAQGESLMTTLAGATLTTNTFTTNDGSALKTVKLVKDATLKVYPGAPHGMCTTLADKVNANLLAFLQS
jgi:hypothetical protein